MAGAIACQCISDSLPAKCLPEAPPSAEANGEASSGTAAGSFRRMPAKRGAENRLQVGKARLPTQFAHGQRRIGATHRWIARPPRCLLTGNRSGYHSARLGQTLLQIAKASGK